MADTMGLQPDKDGYVFCICCEAPIEKPYIMALNRDGYLYSEFCVCVECRPIVAECGMVITIPAEYLSKIDARIRKSEKKG